MRSVPDSKILHNGVNSTKKKFGIVVLTLLFALSSLTFLFEVVSTSSPSSEENDTLTVFSDGNSKKEAFFTNMPSVNETFYIKLSKNATVNNATMDVSGIGHFLRMNIFGESMEDEFGINVSYAGDVNNDGYDDIVIGAHLSDANGVDSGRIYVFHGSDSGIYTTPNTTIDGEHSGDEFGISVSYAGDVNNDSYDDIIIGTPLNDAGGNADSGRVYVFYGSESGITAAEAIDANTTIDGEHSGDNFGASVSYAGDVNNDSYDDIIVGAPLNDAGGNADSGRVYVFHSNGSGIPATNGSSADSIIDGERAGDHFGFSVSDAGNVNGDEYDDIIIGAPYSDAGAGDDNKGEMYIFHGGAEGIGTLPSTYVNGDDYNDLFGYSVSCAGDVNNDGYDDVIVCAPFRDVGGSDADAGATYVFHGSSSGIVSYTHSTADANTTIEGEWSYDYFGVSVSCAGDVNNDGYDDVVVGADGEDLGGTDAGRTYIFHGGEQGIGDNRCAADADIILDGGYEGDAFGGAVSNAGDVNGDGYADIVIGARLFDGSGSDSGGICVIYGGASGIPENPITTADGEYMGDKFGCSVSSAGDVNGDGYDDVIVGAYRNSDAANESGKVYIFHGSASGIYTLPNSSIVGEELEYGHFGMSVSCAGDVNNDGYDDIVVGASGIESTQTKTGRGKAYIFYGGPAGINISKAGDADTIIKGEAVEHEFGCSVSNAGDVNDDGYSDVIIGAHEYDGAGNELDVGKVYIFYGSSLGITVTLAADANATVQGETKYDQFGISVSFAGDVNNDGYDDVIVGASYSDVGGIETGRIYVFHGSGSGITATTASDADTIVDGENEYDQFGASASYAGDVNDDGYGDVVIGAPRFDGVGVSSGKIYIIHGSADGIYSMVNTSIEGEGAGDEFGHSVSHMGDIGLDGYSDIIVGAHKADADGIDSGKVNIYNGSASGILVSQLTTIIGERGQDRFGVCVSDAGDVNHDGYADFIVGADNHPYGRSSKGRMYVYHSSPEGIIGWNSLFYPYNPRVDVGADGDYQWSYQGYYDGTQTTSDFSSELNEYISAHQNETDVEGNILIPINITCDSRGVVMLNNLSIQYTEGELPPALPTNINAKLEGIDRGDVNITWTLSVDDGVDIENYAIYRNASYNKDGIGYGFLAEIPNGTNYYVDSGAGDGDFDNYFYYVQANDTAGKTAKNDTQVGKFVREMPYNESTPRQLISMPLVQSDTNISTVLQTIQGSYNYAQWYDPLDTIDHWKTNATFKPKGFDDLFNVDHKMALWITMTSPDNLTIAGKVPKQTSIQLYKGWNLVGYPSFTNRTVGNALSGLPYDQVEGFDESAPPYYLKVLKDDDIMKAGCGYWVHVTNDCKWIID